MTDKILLAGLRTEIDRVDAELLEVLGRRQKLVEQVLAIKLAEGLPARIPERINAVIDTAGQKAPAAGVDPSLARAVWGTMVEWFVRHEEQQILKRNRS